MIQPQTMLKVLDNSGAKTVKCFKIIGGFKKKYALLGDFIVVSIQKLRNYNLKKKLKIQKGDVVKALIVRTGTRLKKKDGTEFLLKENAVILLNSQNKLIGTRIIGSIPKILKKKVQKFTSLSAGLF